MDTTTGSSYDVTIIGAGLAGLTLARHLLLHTNKTVLLLDKRADPPGPTQKVGESLVQLSGYYLSKVLDLEEHLLREHYLKYNLRFQWKTEGLDNRGLEDYNKSFIRFSSNIATFQLAGVSTFPGIRTTFTRLSPAMSTPRTVPASK